MTCKDCRKYNNCLESSMAKRLSPEEAGKQIGCSAHCVRIKMQRGIWDLGEAYPPKKGVRSTWEYFIWQHKLDKLLGIEKGGGQA